MPSAIPPSSALAAQASGATLSAPTHAVPADAPLTVAGGGSAVHHMPALASFLRGLGGQAAEAGQPGPGLGGALAAAISGRRLGDPGQAELYAQEIAPLWTRPFAQLLLSQAPQLGKGTILDLLCRAGEVGLPLVRRNPRARLVAIDTSAALLGLARQEAGSLVGKRVFLRGEKIQSKLPFDSEVYDLVVSNLGLLDVAEPRQFLRELLRVAKPGATVLATLPLRDSFAEFHDLLTRLVGQRPREAALLEGARTSLPDALTLYSWALEAGLQDVAIVTQPFSLVFAGGPDFFFSPLIARGPLAAWLPALGESEEGKQVAFTELCAAIDQAASGEGSGQTGAAFAVTIRAACLRARRPLPPPALSFDEDPENAPTRPGGF
jgi:SAM-dependent methyltransferase